MITPEDNLKARAVTFEESGHVELVHEKCDNWHCQFCIGGLFACIRCGSFEGATTTHCPGEDMGSIGDKVYAGEVDYRFGEWVNIGSPHTPNRGWDLQTGESL